MHQTQVHPQMNPQQQPPAPQPQMQQQQWQPQQQQQQWAPQPQLQQQQQQQQWQQQRAPQQPQVMYAQQTPPTERAGFNKRMVNILGIMQISFGCGSILLQAISIGLATGLFFVGHGIWCSVFYIIAGALTIAASRTLNSCMIVSSMVLSIFAAIFAGIHLCMSAGSIAFIKDSYYYWNDEHIKDGPAIFLEVLALLIALAEMIAAIVTSVYDCKTTCCTTTAQSGQTYLPVQYVNMPGGQTVPVVVLGPNTTPNQHMMINQGMVMSPQQPVASANIQGAIADAPPAYTSLTGLAGQENKEQQ